MNLILSLLAFIPFVIHSQTEYNWELQYNDTKITTDTRDIGLYISGLNVSEEDYAKIEVVPDQFSDKIKCETIGFSNKGLLVKLHIGVGRELIGRDRVLLVRRNDSNQDLGKVKFPIGGKDPFVEAVNSYGTLRIGTNEPAYCMFEGSNFDGVFQVLTADNKVIVDSIVAKTQSNNRLEVVLRPNDDEQTYRTTYKFKYWTFDPTAKDIKPVTTSEFEAAIQLRNSSVVDLVTENKEFFVSDIIANGGELTLPVSKSETMLEQIDFRNIQLVQGELISGNSWVEFNNNSSSTLHLFFDNYEKLTSGRKHIKLKTNGQVEKEYKVTINLLQDPEVEEVFGKNGDLNFILSKEHKQTLKIKGERLQDLTLISTDFDSTFSIMRSLNLDNLLVFEIELLREDADAQEYYFKLVRGNVPNEIVVDQIGLDFEEPRIPQDIQSLLVCKSGTRPITLQKDLEEEVYDGRDDLVLSFDPTQLEPGLGEQSFKVTVNYYNPDGSLITSEIHRSNSGSENILINNSNGNHSDYDITIPFKYNSNDYIREWGYAEVIISHSPDFYKQELGRKDTYVQKIRFVSKHRTSVTGALTIPPGLGIIGKNDQLRFELLPINVGFGLRFDFRKTAQYNYAQRKVSAGLYVAGVNFAGAQRSTEEGEANFIKQGDISIMGLMEYHLRRADNFVKIPVFIGPGVALPINGVSARGFIAFGIGINL